MPSLYLDGFCDDNGMVWTYPKSVTDQEYPQRPNNVAIENYFYSLYGNGVDPDTFEDALAEIVESPAAGPLMRLKEGEIPSFDDRQRLWTCGSSA